MSASDEIDRRLVELAQKFAAIPKGIAGDIRSEESSREEEARIASPVASAIGGDSHPPRPAVDERPDPAISPAPSTSTSGKQVRRADEIAGIIVKSLRAIEGCPDRGFIVTVYGSNPWNAMLTIRPEAGPRIDRQLWGARVQDIGVRLRSDFDVADTATVAT